MSLHQANKDKPRAQKCRHFCFSFDNHNYCPTCREGGKGDDPCVTSEAPCHICTSLTDEQLQKIQNRKRYLKKQKAETSSKDELDLLGEGDRDSFTGSNADLESAADTLFTSPPRPQPLAFSSLSLKTPAKAVPPTPGTVLQNKIQRNLEKSLGDSLNIHIQQQMGSFQASMLEAFQSLREELAIKKPAEVDPSPHASKAGPSSNIAAHLDLPPLRSSTNAQSEAMDVDVGPALPPRRVLNQSTSDQYVAPSEAIPKDSSYSHKKQSHRQTVAPSSASDQLDEDSDEPRIHPRPKKHSDKSKHKSRSRYVSSSEEDHSPVARHRSSKPSRAQPSGAASDQDPPQHDPDSPYYREVALSDIPSQYSEEVDTFRRILSLPDPRDSMPRSSTSVLGQHRALTCLSKSLAHILQRELYSMANTGLLRREAEMTLLHPQLGETRRQELRNSSFWDSSLFESQLVKEGEDFLLKKGTSKDSQSFAPYQNKLFRGPHKKRGSYRKRPYGGNTSQSSNQSFPSGRGKSNFRGSRGRFRPHNRGRAPLLNDSSKASLSPPVGSRLHSFKRDWLINKCSQNMLNIITKAKFCHSVQSQT